MMQQDSKAQATKEFNETTHWSPRWKACRMWVASLGLVLADCCWNCDRTGGQGPPSVSVDGLQKGFRT